MNWPRSARSGGGVGDEPVGELHRTAQRNAAPAVDLIRENSQALLRNAAKEGRWEEAVVAAEENACRDVRPPPCSPIQMADARTSPP